jgi:hypothetical protein
MDPSGLCCVLQSAGCKHSVGSCGGETFDSGKIRRGVVPSPCSPMFPHVFPSSPLPMFHHLPPNFPPPSLTLCIFAHPPVLPCSSLCFHHRPPMHTCPTTSPLSPGLAVGSHCRQAKAMVQQLAASKRWPECHLLLEAGAEAVSPRTCVCGACECMCMCSLLVLCVLCACVRVCVSLCGYAVV